MHDNDLSYCGGCGGLDYRPLHDPGDPVLICSMILASAIISSPSPAAIKRGRGHEWSVAKPGAPIIGARFYCRRQRDMTRIMRGCPRSFRELVLVPPAYRSMAFSLTRPTRIYHSDFRDAGRRALWRTRKRRQNYPCCCAGIYTVAP